MPMLLNMVSWMQNNTLAMQHLFILTLTAMPINVLVDHSTITFLANKLRVKLNQRTLTIIYFDKESQADDQPFVS